MASDEEAALAKMAGTLRHHAEESVRQLADGYLALLHYADRTDRQRLDLLKILALDERTEQNAELAALRTLRDAIQVVGRALIERKA